MQCIGSLVTQHYAGTCVGTARARARAVRPAAACEPPRRLGSLCSSTVPVIAEVGADRAAPRSHAAGNRLARFRAAHQGALLRVAFKSRHARSTAHAARPVWSVAGLRLLRSGTLPARWPPSQYLPFPPVSYSFVRLVAHQANHSFERTASQPLNSNVRPHWHLSNASLRSGLRCHELVKRQDQVIDRSASLKARTLRSSGSAG